MSDDNPATATIPVRAAAGAKTSTDALHAAARRLQLTLDAISRARARRRATPATLDALDVATERVKLRKLDIEQTRPLARLIFELY